MKCELTDLVPLFLRNGALFFVQDVDNVTRTSHLNNEFRAAVACKLTVDNSTTMACSAHGGLLSLGDYESNSDIEKCIADDCDYKLTVSIVMTKSDGSIEMTLETSYRGKTTRYEQRILQFSIFV